MAEEKNKPRVTDQETIKPGGKKRQEEELSEKDLDKAAGGGGTFTKIDY